MVQRLPRWGPNDSSRLSVVGGGDGRVRSPNHKEKAVNARAAAETNPAHRGPELRVRNGTIIAHSITQYVVYMLLLYHHVVCLIILHSHLILSVS